MFLSRLNDVSAYEKKNLLLLLAIGWLYTLGIYLSNIFVNVFLWKQTESLLLVSLYNLTIYATQVATFVLSGNWVKRIDRVLILRYGILMIAVFFMLVLSFGTAASSYYILLGIVLGCGYGLFWLSFNVLTFEVTEPYTRDFFNGSFGALQSLSGMIGPITAGWLITVLEGYQGYLTIFFISFLLFSCAVVCSMFMTRRNVDGRISFSHVIYETKRNKQWLLLISAHFFQGLREGIFLFLIGLIVFLVTQSEMTLGIYNMLYAAASFVVYQWIYKRFRSSHRPTMILISSLILFFSLFWFINSSTSIEFFIFAIVLGVTFPLFYAPLMSVSYDIIGQAHLAKEYRIEYIIMRDVFLNLGRVVSLLLFVSGLLIFGTEQFMIFAVIIFGLGYAIAGGMISFISKKKKEGI
ncbi:MFS transporter [Halalkalibacillus sediminis]|uniref:MFS transporter n=1 Tax=Halalkalibacillus sediminis TaxID=2018042 RepID=A0A2I0QXG2_9BACI|nr:MFS transporter [Halalkalibacillus sediminis]PKR78999.1 MFS transporter [Halalkalibacillus sediminis]